MEIGRDGATRRELENQMEVPVDAAAEETADVGVAGVADGAELCQKVLLSLLVG